MQFANLPGEIASQADFRQSFFSGECCYSPRGMGGYLRLNTRAGQNQGIGGPLGGAPCLLRGVADVAGRQQPQRVGVDGPGVGEDGGYVVSGYHRVPAPCGDVLRRSLNVGAARGNRRVSLNAKAQ